MDRVLPAWLGKINSKTHAPLNAIILIGIVSLLFGVLYDFLPVFGKMTLSFTILAVIMFAVTCFAAAVWPYVKPEMFNSTVAAKYKVGGVPLITICGFLFLPPAVYITWSALSVPELGMMSVEGWLTNIGLFVFGLIVYFAFKAYRKSKESLDVSMIYNEIPPE
jgi:basic amino acid/polyamine antiporter, APA family